MWSIPVFRLQLCIFILIEHFENKSERLNPTESSSMSVFSLFPTGEDPPGSKHFDLFFSIIFYKSF